MSMGNNGFSEYAFVFTENTVKTIAKKILSDYSDEKYQKDKFFYADYVREELDLNYEAEFSGDAYSLNEDGKPDFFKEKSYNCELLLYLPLKRGVSLFQATYKNIEEIVNEIKGEIGNYLPEDFNYKQNIVFICGTYYG